MILQKCTNVPKRKCFFSCTLYLVPVFIYLWEQKYFKLQSITSYTLHSNPCISHILSQRSTKKLKWPSMPPTRRDSFNPNQIRRLWAIFNSHKKEMARYACMTINSRAVSNLSDHLNSLRQMASGFKCAGQNMVNSHKGSISTTTPLIHHHRLFIFKCDPR